MPAIDVKRLRFSRDWVEVSAIFFGEVPSGDADCRGCRNVDEFDRIVGVQVKIAVAPRKRIVILNDEVVTTADNPSFESRLNGAGR